MKTVSLITGKVRDQSRALEVARSLVALRAQGLVDAILFSTWTGELDRHRQLLDYVLTQGIHVVETTEQKWSVQESHQKIPVLTALNFVGEDSYVTRHRFDRVMPAQPFADHMRHIKQHGPERIADPASPLGHKITVNSVLVDVPLFISDLVFSGMRSDVCALAQINGHHQLYSGINVNPEFAFWASLLAGRYPIIASYLSTFPGIAYRDPVRRSTLKEVQRGSDFFARLFALHAHVAGRYLNIGYATGDGGAWDAPVDLDRLLFSDAWEGAGPDLFFFYIAGQVATKRNSVFRHIARGNLVKTEFSEKVMACLDEFDRSDGLQGHRPLPTIGAQALAYAKALSARGIAGIDLSGLAYNAEGRVRFQLGQVMSGEASLSRNTAVQKMGEWECF